MDLGIILGICAIAIAVMGIAYQNFAVLSRIKERLASLETKVEVFWKAVENKLADMIKSPANPQKDALLDKMVDSTLTDTEAHELRDILQGECTNKVMDGGTALAYALAIGRLELLIFDFKGKQW